MNPLVKGTETDAKARAANQNANLGACFAIPPKSDNERVCKRRSITSTARNKPNATNP